VTKSTLSSPLLIGDDSFYYGFLCGKQTGTWPEYMREATSIWSRGMIPASGAGGPGFKPRNGPEENLFDPVEITSQLFPKKQESKSRR
jgi:hypothetical protein